MFGAHFFGGLPRKLSAPNLGPQIGVVHTPKGIERPKPLIGPVIGGVVVPPDQASKVITPTKKAKVDLAKAEFRATGKIGVQWVTPILDGSGYAEAGRNYIASLMSVGVGVFGRSVTFEDSRSDYGRAGKLAEEAMRNGDLNFAINIIYLTPENFPIRREAGVYNIGFFAWETDRLPDEWVSACNGMDEIWVPCQWTADVAKNSGVVRPIRVFGHCASLEEYKNGEKLSFEEVDPSWYKFYSIFQWTERKNPRGLLKAYLKAFSDKDPVILILKTYRSNYSHGEQQAVIREIERIKQEAGGKNQPKIMALLGMMTKDEIQALHRTCDCFTLIHRAEGWGLPHFEACLMSKPVITTGYSGNLEFNRPESSYLVNYKMTAVRGMDWIRWYTSNMVWAEPNVDQCRDLMRHVYTNRKEAEQRGLMARAYAARNFSWGAIGNRMKARLSEIMVKL